MAQDNQGKDAVFSRNTEKRSLREGVLFFRRWLANPLRLGAVFPSSRFLSKSMAEAAISLCGPQDYILELGAGTGSFTGALLEAGVPQHRLICIEIDPQLAAHVSKKFPGLRVIVGDACQMEHLIPPHTLGKIGVVVSGIPMITLPKNVGRCIVEKSWEVLRAQGSFLQFTYSPFSNISASAFHLEKRRWSFVLKNFLPATIWVYKRKAA